MRKKWKEKFKSFVKNEKILIENGILTSIMFPILFLSFGEIFRGSIPETILFTVPSVAFLCILWNLSNPEKEKQKNEESKRNDNEKKEQDYLQALYEEIEYSTHTVPYHMLKLVNLIKKIQRECVLTEEERIHLTITVPKSLLRMLEIFRKIEYQYREEIEKEILAFLEEKHEEYNKIYIEPHQRQLVSDCKQALQEIKEQKHEYIHVTIEE